MIILDGIFSKLLWIDMTKIINDFRYKMKVVAMLLVCLAMASGKEAKNREGRLFLVSATTSTSTLTTSSICYSTGSNHFFSF